MVAVKKALKIRAHSKKFTFQFEGSGVPQGVVGKYYPAEDVVFSKGPTPVRNPPRVRSSIVPGTVLILIAGRFRGKRVVCLKKLTSGLLLISADDAWIMRHEESGIPLNDIACPYSLNGVPLRRVNQRYVIATSTKVSLDGVDVSAIDDGFFSRKDEKDTKPAEDQFFASNEQKTTTISPERKSAQTAVDAALQKNVEEVELLSAYLKAKFSLSKGDKPHLLKF